MAVNSKSLQKLKHSDAVCLLKAEGPHVILTIRSNPVLQGRQPNHKIYYKYSLPTDMFSEDVTKGALVHNGDDRDHKIHKPLPQGWSEKNDQKTGRPYYEW